MPVDQQQSREYGTAMVAKDLIRVARLVSGHTGETMQEVLDRILRPALAREQKKVAAQIVGHDLGGEG